MKSSFVALSCATAFVMSGQALAQSMGNADSDAPIVTKIHRIQPYEIVEGTPINVSLETGDPGVGGMMAGIVSLNVYDRFENLAIPKGSKLIGRMLDQVNDRREVQWDGLQLPGTATLRLDPPLEGCMPDGSAGMTVSALRQRGANVAALVTKAFVVPH
ncbi:conjugal transfer protein [Burkholderia cenocepacia]|uniref:conjugal transfer protein n=1 Tax=Burkholderia cenocepacia TaxID=95486 RepID=UPI002B252AD4|nr:conjugal transfer protein [Burkholderia cenocepacia]MEB2610588.1 conjugal transfer protein [Burkholderia cenocepacia]